MFIVYVIAHLSDFVFFNIVICAGSSIDLVIGQATSLLVEFEMVRYRSFKGDGNDVFTSLFAVYNGTSPSALEEATQFVKIEDSPRQVECIWEVTAPQRTRIEITVEEFDTTPLTSNNFPGNVVTLMVGNDQDPVNKPFISRGPQHVSPFRDYSKGNEIWIMLDYKYYLASINRLQLVMTAYVPKGTNVSFFVGVWFRNHSG